ncbi:unnamed protein product [Protopolystoma xenopodis]|uniref:Uncharacterized protein n=1 Tax=Protopolystoma xenopodis TaxID=117903 RepID=A0A448X5W6_9PLAT|nr:unnamed protein product [Protopolystoma xenopodis]
MHASSETGLPYSTKRMNWPDGKSIGWLDMAFLLTSQRQAVIEISGTEAVLRSIRRGPRSCARTSWTR